MLAAARVEHLVYPYTVAVTPGVSTYRMPTRSAGGTLRDVVWLDAAGNPWPLTQISSDQVLTVGAVSQQGTPGYYYLRNYDVVLVPVPNVAGTLSMPYYARPNRLVLPDTESMLVASATYTGTGPYTLTLEVPEPPAGMGTLFSYTPYDVVAGEPGFATLLGAVVGVLSDNDPAPWTFTLTGLASQLPTVAAGDYLCLAGQAPVPQCPVELFGLLAVRGARRALKAVGDDRWQALADDVGELEDKARDWLTTRVAGDTQQAGGQIGQSGLVAGRGLWGVMGFG
jgi:hypothetical protein